MDLLIFSNQEYYPEYHDWRLFSTQCKLHPEAKVTSYLYGHSKNLRNSLKFLLALQRVVFFVTFRLCWQHCKLLGDPEWPQLEMRTGFFPLEDTNYMYPPYSTARTKVWYFQWYFGTAASHKWKSQWKWKSKNRTKNNAQTYRSFFKPQERITLKWIYCFVNFLLLSILCSLIVISLRGMDPWLCLESSFPEVSCQTNILCWGGQVLWKSDHVNLWERRRFLRLEEKRKRESRQKCDGVLIQKCIFPFKCILMNCLEGFVFIPI